MDHSDVENQGGTVKWDRVVSYIHVLYVFSKSKRVRSWGVERFCPPTILLDKHTPQREIEVGGGRCGAHLPLALQASPHSDLNTTVASDIVFILLSISSDFT